MTAVVAHCPQCDLIFKSRLFGANLMVQRLVLTGNREMCPRCRGMAAIVDGVFTAAFGHVRLIDGPQITREILRRFTELVQQAQRNEISADTLQEQAGKLDSKLGEAVAEFRKSGLPSWPTMLLLAAMTLNSCKVQHNVNHSIDWNRAFEQAIEFLQRSPPQKPAPTQTIEE